MKNRSLATYCLIAATATAFMSAPISSYAFLEKLGETAVKVGKTAAKDTSLQDEIDMGRQFSSIVMGAFSPGGNEGLNRYVSKVGQTIAEVSDRKDLEYHFQVVDARDSRGNPVVNAFSTPGGYVFVTQGLLERVRSEAELAGVLAHEVAHISKKHVLKAIKTQKIAGAVTELGTEAIREHTSGVSEYFASVVGPALINNLFEKGLSRGDEYEADQAAAQYAAKAGYDPRGLIFFLETVKAREGKGHYGTLLRTHPKPDDRIKRVKKTIESKHLVTDGKQQTLNARWKAQGVRLAVQ